MTPANRKIEWLVWGGLFLVMATLVVVFLLGEVRARDSLTKELPLLGNVADFNLTNQTGQAVTLATLRGHVWVGDIIFTRCPGPCRKMTHEMNELSEALPARSNARLVTLTTDPTYDTPPVLRDYIQQLKLNVSPDRWLFLTGTKQQIAQLAIDSLKLAAMEKPVAHREAENDLFIHATIFVVVDKKAQLRAIFQSTGEGVDFQQIKPQILDTVRRLERQG